MSLTMHYKMMVNLPDWLANRESGDLGELTLPDTVDRAPTFRVEFEPIFVGEGYSERRTLEFTSRGGQVTVDQLLDAAAAGYAEFIEDVGPHLWLEGLRQREDKVWMLDIGS
jgi:hypothetical protein